MIIDDSFGKFHRCSVVIPFNPNCQEIVEFIIPSVAHLLQLMHVLQFKGSHYLVAHSVYYLLYLLALHLFLQQQLEDYRFELSDNVPTEGFYTDVGHLAMGCQRFVLNGLMVLPKSIGIRLQSYLFSQTKGIKTMLFVPRIL